MKPREAVAAMPIGIWLLFVGAMRLANALNLTGAGAMIGDFIAKVSMTLKYDVLIYAVFFIVPFVMTQFMFNQTVSTILMPITIQACMSLGVNPVGPMICVSGAALTAFMSPMATGTVPYDMAAGGYDMRSVLKQSWLPRCCLRWYRWRGCLLPFRFIKGRTPVSGAGAGITQNRNQAGDFVPWPDFSQRQYGEYLLAKRFSRLTGGGIYIKIGPVRF